MHSPLTYRACIRHFTSWSLTGILSKNAFSDNVWAFDVWFGNSHWIVPMPTYFQRARQEGIGAIVKHVSRMRADFHGERLLIRPQFPIHLLWEHWKELTDIPICQLRGTSPLIQAWYLGYHTMTFATRNNFTFSTVKLLSPAAQISTRYTFWNVDSSKGEDFILSLDSFMHSNTLMTSHVLLPSPFTLSSIRMPVSPHAALFLMALTISAATLLKASSQEHRLGLSYAGLLVTSSFCAQAISVKGK